MSLFTSLYLSLLGASAQALVVRSIVERCTRASIADRVLRVFPSQLAPLLPPLDTPPHCDLLPPPCEPLPPSSPGLDESMVSVDTNMAVAADTSMDLLSLSTRHVTDMAEDTSPALGLLALVEARADPEDVEDWVTARRREALQLCLRGQGAARSLLEEEPAPVGAALEDQVDAAAAALLLQVMRPNPPWDLHYPTLLLDLTLHLLFRPYPNLNGP